LAHQLSLVGFILNNAQGAVIEIEGQPTSLEKFQSLLKSKLPPTARIEEITYEVIPIKGENTFTIRPSESHTQLQSVIPPDLATCHHCLDEINDPHSRRYRYPFTTCTQCGPRYSVVLDLPYDRTRTTMKQFSLCDQCQAEYENMADRRFHAEAIACPDCGPFVSLWDEEGNYLTDKEDALHQASNLIIQGKVLAVKGLGGFQLWVDATSTGALEKLRHRKNRPRKPIAVLFPSLEVLEQHCYVSPKEEIILTSPQAPIVLLRRKHSSSLAPGVALQNPYVGAMLPCTPLHHILTSDLQTPVVATSGNLSEEPIVFKEQEMLKRLRGIADGFLVHNRPIARPVDDSVVRVVNEEILVIRRARGYTPLPITMNGSMNHGNPFPAILALGGHLKNTVAVTAQDQVIMTQHLGDLASEESCAQYDETIADQLRFFDLQPQAIACDLHPDYRSTIVALQLQEKFNVPVIPIQHHHAHIASCMAEHRLQSPVLGVAWDGAGYGTDRSMWGGEFLICDYTQFNRVAHLRPFRLPGGEICMHEPRRVALSLLYATFGTEALNLDLPPIRSLEPNISKSLTSLLEKVVNSPITTSMGRLFDGVSSILGLCQMNTFEAEAAMALEFCGEQKKEEGTDKSYSIPLENQEGVWIADWRPLVRALVKDSLERVNPTQIAHAFHQALAELVLDVANTIKTPQLVLTGGVFQNVLLTKLAKTHLKNAGYTVYSHQQIPSNDGGIALGQIMVAAHLFRNKGESL